MICRLFYSTMIQRNTRLMGRARCGENACRVRRRIPRCGMLWRRIPDVFATVRPPHQQALLWLIFGQKGGN
jgi:hypothetical protein